MKLLQAQQIAQEILDSLIPTCQKVEIAGSVRRQKPEVKDIEIVCIPTFQGSRKRRHTKWIKGIFSLAQNDVKNILKGNLGTGKYICIRLKEGIKLDLFIATPKNWGYIYMLRTGSAAFSKQMVIRLKQFGFKGRGGYVHLVTQSDETIFPIETEKQFFNIVGMDVPCPKERV